MLIYSMGVSVDGFIADREGAFGWSAPSEELFRFHTAEVGKLGSCLLGRRLYETMLVWETDPSLREDELGAAFADVWCALPKDVEIGGAGLAAQAIELGLVDELRMFRYPVVVGGGTPYLPLVTEDIRLDLIETRTFGSRVIYERYQRVRGVL
jgi:dihydrofolate reductase